MRKGSERIADDLPIITHGRIPAPTERQEIIIQFTYQAGKEEIVSLSATVENTVGVIEHTLPSQAARITGSKGEAVLRVQLNALPAGASILRLALIDKRGRRGPEWSSTISVPGGREGAKTGVLEFVRVDHQQITRPDGENSVNAWCSIGYQRGDADLAGFYVQVSRSKGDVRTFALPARLEPSQRDLVTKLWAFGSRDELGAYDFIITALDNRGNLSNSQNVRIELVSANGYEGPAIETFSPASAAAGETIVIRGKEFQPKGNSVSFDDIQADVIHHASSEIHVIVPRLYAPCRIRLSNRQGLAVSSDEFTPKMTIAVFPEAFELPAGRGQRFSAAITGTTEQHVVWKVNGIAGGNAAFGTITSEGTYTAPFSSHTGSITISATAEKDRSVSADAKGRIIPHPTVPGPIMLGPLGGTVRSENRGAFVHVPPGALAKPVSVNLALSSHDDVPLSRGMISVTAAKLEPAGIHLRKPADLVLPLRIYLEPGTSVPLYTFEGKTKKLKDTGFAGRVGGGGNVLEIKLPRFYDYVLGLFDLGEEVVDIIPRQPQFRPSISSIIPQLIDEGATVPLLITGSNFVPGLTAVSVLYPGLQEVVPEVDVRTVYVTTDGTNIGVTLKIGVVPEWQEGEVRTLLVRASTPAGSADGTINIRCWDELDLPSGVFTLGSSKKFSRITVGPGARLQVPQTFPPIEISAIENIRIDAVPHGQAGLVEVEAGNGSDGAIGDDGGIGGVGGLLKGGQTVPGGIGGDGGGGRAALETEGGEKTARPLVVWREVPEEAEE